jgi:hypothetical protein
LPQGLSVGRAFGGCCAGCAGVEVALGAAGDGAGFACSVREAASAFELSPSSTPSSSCFIHEGILLKSISSSSSSMICSHSTVDDGEDDEAVEVEGAEGRDAAGRGGVGSVLVAPAGAAGRRAGTSCSLAAEAGMPWPVGRGALGGPCLCESLSLQHQRHDKMRW